MYAYICNIYAYVWMVDIRLVLKWIYLCKRGTSSMPIAPGNDPPHTWNTVRAFTRCESIINWAWLS